MIVVRSRKQDEPPPPLPPALACSSLQIHSLAIGSAAWNGSSHPPPPPPPHLPSRACRWLLAALRSNPCDSFQLPCSYQAVHHISHVWVHYQHAVWCPASTGKACAWLSRSLMYWRHILRRKYCKDFSLKGSGGSTLVCYFGDVGSVPARHPVQLVGTHLPHLYMWVTAVSRPSAGAIRGSVL